jgi:S-(hydroxymethyl)glutathione dehydrogenase/alcohol dehydrogenase
VLSSAHPVIAVDIKDGKLDMAKNFGATHMINSSSQDPVATIEDILPDGPDVVFETTGITKLIETSYNMSAKKGRIVCIGVPRSDQDITIHSLKLHFGTIITGCEGGQTEPSEDIPRYLRLYEAGKLELDDLVTHRFPLEKVNDGLDTLRSGDAGRCMLEMSHS